MPLTVGRLCDQSAVRRLHLDDVTFTYVVDGAMSMPPARFLPSVPASYWSDYADGLDAHGRIPMSAGGLLVERDGYRLLIDAGLGAVVADAELGRSDSGDFLKTLTAIGLDPSDIDMLAFTHLHGDHTGWAFGADGAGGRPAVFPNATYLMSGAEWAAHTEEGDGAAADPYSIAEPVRQAGNLALIEEGAEIAPGVIALVTPGHSPGHTSYIVTSEAGNRLVAFGDTFHVPAQLAHTDWTSIPDAVPGQVPAARAKLLDELRKPRTIGFGFHFGDQPFGRVVPDRGALCWQPVPTSVLLPSPRTC